MWYSLRVNTQPQSMQKGSIYIIGMGSQISIVDRALHSQQVTHMNLLHGISILVG